MLGVLVRVRAVRGACVQLSQRLVVEPRFIEARAGMAGSASPDDLVAGVLRVAIPDDQKFAVTVRRSPLLRPGVARAVAAIPAVGCTE